MFFVRSTWWVLVLTMAMLCACASQSPESLALPPRFQPVVLEQYAQATPPTRLGPPVDLGLFATQGLEEYTRQANLLGLTPHVGVYITLGEDELPCARFSDVVDLCLVVLEFPDVPGGVLGAVIGGEFDDELRDLGHQIELYGLPVIVRPMHEGNLDNSSWAAYASGNDPSEYAPAFRHVVEVIRGVTDNALFDQNYNRKSQRYGNWDTEDFALLFAGDAYVDVVSISSYNRCGTTADRQTVHSFAEEFRDAYDAVVTITDRPIAVAETSTSPFCGVNRILWFRDLLASLGAEFPRVVRVTFFFKTVEPGEASVAVRTPWGPQGEEIPAFRALVDAYRSSPARIGTYEVPFLTTPTPDDVEDDQSGSLIPEPCRAPWSFLGRMDHTIVNEPSTGINRNGDAFGDIGTRIVLQYEQALEWCLGEEMQIGPYSYVRVAVSDNFKRWWDNQLPAGGGGIRVCNDIRPTVADWGRICFSVGGEYLYYPVSAVPRNLEDGEGRFGLRVTINWGGDWLD